jgi:hypothetical protein
MRDEALNMWVIYDHPRDMPDCFVARLWRIEAGRTTPTQALRAAGTLREVAKLGVGDDVSRSQRAAARPAVQGAERVSGAGEVDHAA